MRTAKPGLTVAVACCFLAALSPALAQTQSFDTYLKSMTSAEITFSGRLEYDSSDLSDNPFIFYNADQEPFPATIEAGRETRERVKRDCRVLGVNINIKNLCEVEGIGYIEIRGSGILLNIRKVIKLQKP
ncbi:hypothetical protein [Roseovarius sp.]|uniref:hypothetical protein n=1 Tax=Roseovarius sp. TaxID=1486281 RepID=UPI003A977EB9